MDAEAEMVPSEEQLQAATPDHQDEDGGLTAAEPPVSGEPNDWHLIIAASSFQILRSLTCVSGTAMLYELDMSPMTMHIEDQAVIRLAGCRSF